MGLFWGYIGLGIGNERMQGTRSSSCPPIKNCCMHLSRDQNPPYLQKTGAFRNRVWCKQSVVFRKALSAILWQRSCRARRKLLFLLVLLVLAVAESRRKRRKQKPRQSHVVNKSLENTSYLKQFCFRNEIGVGFWAPLKGGQPSS